MIIVLGFMSILLIRTFPKRKIDISRSFTSLSASRMLPLESSWILRFSNPQRKSFGKYHPGTHISLRNLIRGSGIVCFWMLSQIPLRIPSTLTFILRNVFCEDPQTLVKSREIVWSRIIDKMGDFTWVIIHDLPTSRYKTTASWKFFLLNSSIFFHFFLTMESRHMDR